MLDSLGNKTWPPYCIPTLRSTAQVVNLEDIQKVLVLCPIGIISILPIRNQHRVFYRFPYEFLKLNLKSNKFGQQQYKANKPWLQQKQLIVRNTNQKKSTYPYLFSKNKSKTQEKPREYCSPRELHEYIPGHKQKKKRKI